MQNCSAPFLFDDDATVLTSVALPVLSTNQSENKKQRYTNRMRTEAPIGLPVRIHICIALQF